MVEEFRARRELIVDGLNAIPGIRCRMPHGAFYVFPNVGGTGMNGTELADKLLYEGGVCVLSGHGLRQGRRRPHPHQLRQLAREPASARSSASKRSSPRYRLPRLPDPPPGNLRRMTLATFAIVLGAAFIHALWNLIVVQARDRTATTTVVIVFGALAFVPLALMRWDVQPEAWPFIALSSALELVYFALLVSAYERADLIARLSHRAWLGAGARPRPCGGVHQRADLSRTGGRSRPRGSRSLHRPWHSWRRELAARRPRARRGPVDRCLRRGRQGGCQVRRPDRVRHADPSDLRGCSPRPLS